MYALAFLAIGAAAAPALLDHLQDQFAVQKCLSWLPYSCQNSTVVPDSQGCCFEIDGIVMQTQFWNYNPDYAAAVKNAFDLAALQEKIDRSNYTSETLELFTIHGLWDDVCDGTYDQFCDPSLFVNGTELQDIIVNQFGEQALYETMQKYWISSPNTPSGNEGFWEHEWNKHGTCFNTLKPGCFSNYQKHQNAVSFFAKVVEVWSKLTTYEFLEKDGIVPTVARQYALSAVQAALAKNHLDRQVYVGCTGDLISEIWYYHVVRGNVLAGSYKPVDSLGETNCPAQVWYLPSV